MKIQTLVKPTKLHVVCVRGPFDKAKSYLESNGYVVASLQDIAEASMEMGKDANVSKYMGLTRESFIYVAQKDEFRLTKNSPIMAYPKQAVQCDSRNESFYLNNEQLEKSIVGSVRISAEVIPTNRFGKNEVTTYLFGESAQAYGEFLQSLNIKKVHISTPGAEEKSFARPLDFWNLQQNCEITGYYKGFSRSSNSTVFGVPK